MSIIDKLQETLNPEKTESRSIQLNCANLELQHANTPEESVVAIATLDGFASTMERINIDGIDLSRHSDKTPLPIKPMHIRVLSDGTPPVIGYATKISKSKVNGKKSLIIEFKWRRKEDGSLYNDLVQEYHNLVKQGLINDVSIGGKITQEEVIRDEKGNFVGWDILKMTLTELSIVDVGAMEGAKIINADLNRIELGFKKLDVILGDVLTKMNILENRLDELVAQGHTNTPESDEKSDKIKEIEKFLKERKK